MIGILYIVDFGSPPTYGVILDQKIYVGDYLADIKVFNNVRKENIVLGDEIIFQVNYTKRPDVIDLFPNLFLEVGRERIWEKAIKEPDIFSKENSRFYSYNFKLNQTGLIKFGFYTTIFKDTGGGTSSLGFVSHDDIPLFVETLSEVQQRDANIVVRQGLIVSSIVGTVTLVAIILNSRISNRQAKVLEEQKKIMKENVLSTTMFKVFETLSDTQSKVERGSIIDEYWKLKDEGKSAVFKKTKVESEVYKLRTILNQMGILFKANLLDEKLFLDSYWETIIRYWCVLKDDIEYDRKFNERIAIPFEELMFAAMKYWDRLDPKPPLPSIYRKPK